MWIRPIGTAIADLEFGFPAPRSVSPNRSWSRLAGLARRDRSPFLLHLRASSAFSSSPSSSSSRSASAPPSRRRLFEAPAERRTPLELLRRGIRSRDPEGEEEGSCLRKSGWIGRPKGSPTAHRRSGCCWRGRRMWRRGVEEGEAREGGGAGERGAAQELRRRASREESAMPQEKRQLKKRDYKWEKVVGDFQMNPNI